MSELTDIAAAVDSIPGSTAEELRDRLHTQGRVSITMADISRVLRRNIHRFRGVSGPPERWWPSDPAGSPAPQRCRASNATAPTWPGPSLYRWQIQALEAWRARGGRGIIDAVTGTGKTMVGVAAVYEELGRGGQACVLVPTRDLLYQWQQVLGALSPTGTRIGLVGDGHRDDLGRCDVVIAVVNSARTADLRPRRPGGLVVADECHRYATDANRLVLREWFVRRMGLSATYERADDAHLDHLDPYFGGRCFTMGYAQATHDGVIAPFELCLVGVGFSEEDNTEYRSLGLTMAGLRSRLLRSAEVRSEPVGAFLTDVARCARTDSNVASVAAGYLWAMAERRRLLAETPAKLDALDWLSGDVARATRTIVFTRSINAAEAAAARLRAGGHRSAAVHSGLGTPTCRERLRAFTAGLTPVLCAAELLDEGIDVPDADVAIVLASSRSRRQMLQRLGRVLRRKSDGRHARFVNVYVRRTSEDPASGAHASFLSEVTPLARSVSRIEI